MIVVTTPSIEGYEVERVIGQVYGLTVRSRGLGGNILAWLRGLAGGEITEFTQMLEDARKLAMDRMVQNAHQMGANAVLAMRFDSSEMGTTMSEIVAYGTAAIVRAAGAGSNEMESNNR